MTEPEESARLLERDLEMFVDPTTFTMLELTECWA